jgi:hypothetical protein
MDQVMWLKLFGSSSSVQARLVQAELVQVGSVQAGSVQTGSVSLEGAFALNINTVATAEWLEYEPLLCDLIAKAFL